MILEQNSCNRFILFYAVITIIFVIIAKMSSLPIIANISAIVSVVILIAITLIGIKRWISSKHPLQMLFPNKEYEADEIKYFKKSKTIEGIHGLFPKKLNIAIKIHQESNFKEINIRLVEKKQSCFGKKWIKVSPKIISIRKVIDAERSNSEYIKRTGIVFDRRPDKSGGFDCFYTPTLHCPRGEILWFEIILEIDVKKKWNGYLSFRHSRGGSHRRYIRKKIVITHSELTN